MELDLESHSAEVIFGLLLAELQLQKPAFNIVQMAQTGQMRQVVDLMMLLEQEWHSELINGLRQVLVLLVFLIVQMEKTGLILHRAIFLCVGTVLVIVRNKNYGSQQEMVQCPRIVFYTAVMVPTGQTPIQGGLMMEQTILGMESL